MARIRSIKPEFFKSDDVSALPLRARLTWIGLWTHCDDQGRAKDHLKLIKAAIWPLDQVSLADIEEDLRVLAEHGRIVRYEFGGERFLAVTNWTKHQKINRPTASNIAPPPIGLAPAVRPVTEPRETESYPHVSAHGALTEDSRGEGNGREGKGGEAQLTEDSGNPVDNFPTSEPPKACPKHLNDKNPPPCGVCRGTRQAWEQWHADRRARVDAAPRCQVDPSHRGQPADNCANCRSDRLAWTGRTGAFPLIVPRGAA